MVQVATALSVIDRPPSSLAGAQRLVYLKTQAVIDGIFGKPTESLYAKLLNRIMFVCIVLNFMMMAAETCEGQNFPGSDPGYPYLPDETTYEILDAVFSIVFTIELFGRVAAKKFQKAIVMDPFTLIDFLALCPWFAQLILAIGGVEFSVSNLNGSGHAVVLLRLLRAARLGNILRHFDQSRILYLSIRASLRPLGITMFFLFTLVMLLATALFYAEPCYNVNTCAFTDIFNSAYFIMVTIATVGYGNQVPSLNNWASLMIACVAMLFGQMYFALPVFIVGTNFENTYDNFQWDSKRKKRQRDETLSPFDAQTMHSFTHHLTNTHFQLLSAWRVVQISIQKMLFRSKQDERDTMQAALAQSILLTKIKEAIEKLLVAHGESCGLLQTFVPHKKKSESVNAEARTEEVPDSSKLASVINIFMVSGTLLSVLLFCCESLPELSTTGVETLACKRVVQDYCTNTGFYAATTWELPDEGCFVRNTNSTADFSRQILFTCANVSDDPACYGNGLNFGSLDPTAFDCANSFTATGVNVICYRRQCNRIDTIVDMGPYWIYFEWTFGLGFTLDLALRFVASQDRGRLIRDFYTIFDILAVVPFFVEVFFLIAGCTIAGAVFYEIERGTECFVGTGCWWWGKNVLTPALSQGLPDGKRVLIQDRRFVILPDMKYSTWLAYST
uniref:Ion transport domain-containing protein n=1 Tax=Globisporangium ultimum (strain ATCC 200006 / CBS 805.95 / DAOM BR144) TaxID=431595 RepID=K3WI28_GLOUD